MTIQHKPAPHCYYCNKILDKEKGELSHGCLYCYDSILVERIDARDKKIIELKNKSIELNFSSSKHVAKAMVTLKILISKEKIGLL